MIEIPDTGNRPLRTAHYFYTPERAVADAMAGELRGTGFDVVVERAALGEDWLVKATHLAPWDETLDRYHDIMEALAQRHGATYDGHEVEIGSVLH